MEESLSQFFQQVINNPIFVTFLILFAGIMFGKINFGLFSFGSSGIFVVGFFAGVLGLRPSEAITQIGLVIFMFVIGLRSGPRFFSSFGMAGVPYIIVSATTGIASVIATFICSSYLGFTTETGLGLYTGSLNTTSSLAILMDKGWNKTILSSYGIVYPLGMIMVILFVQLLPLIMKKDLQKEAIKSFNNEKEKTDLLVARKFIVEKKDLTGIPFSEINFAEKTGATISRIKRKGHIIIPDDSTALKLDDIVLAVGSEESLKNMKRLLGMQSHEDLHIDPSVQSRQIVMTNFSLHDATLDSLGISANYHCVVPRVWRGEFELFPARELVLEQGDTLLAVGKINDLDALEKFLGTKRKKTGEVDFFSMSFTIAAGIVLGMIKIPVPWVGAIALGSVGGTLIMAMFLGYFRRIGFLTGHVSHSAESLLKEVGMNFFLAGLGLKSGAGVTAMDAATVLKMISASAFIMIFTMSSAFFVSYRILKMDFIKSMACVCGSLNNSAAIAALSNAVGSDKVNIPFAACYPISLFGIIICSQLLAFFLG